MEDREHAWLGATSSPSAHPASLLASAGGAPGHIDLEAEGAPDGPTARLLGTAAAQWAQSLLEVARFELARADDKANTMFRFYGVVAALSIGTLAGKGWSPIDLDAAAQVMFWAGLAMFLASGLFLGMTLYPRNIRSTPRERLLYFGHVIEYASVDELAGALRAVDHDAEHRLVEQLLSISRLVHTKYALMRRALLSLGAGTVLTLLAVLVDAIGRHA